MSRVPAGSVPLDPDAFAAAFDAVLGSAFRPSHGEGAGRAGPRSTQNGGASFEARLRRAPQDEDVEDRHPKPHLLLAVSGGPDSTALMHAAARWSATAGGPPLVVATVDHGLRPESRREAERVAEQARALGLAHRSLIWRDSPARVSQEAARRARYDLLIGLAREIGAAAILTAHTLDDQAETILMRLAAGSGPAGLAGMRPTVRRDGVLIHRPFLGFAKSRLVASCVSEGWDFVEDPSNADPRFARVRWRGLMPALAAEGLDARRLARFAARVRRAEDALDRAARQALAACRHAAGAGGLAPITALDLGRLSREPDEIVIRAVALAVTPVPALRLDRLESSVAALLAAIRDRRPLRRTLAGRLLALDREGRLEITSEPPRARGRRGALTTPAVAPPHSLGIGEGHA